MEGGRRLCPSGGGASAEFPWSNDASAELWHSTPVKKKDAGASLDASQPAAPSSFKVDEVALPWAVNAPPIPADTMSGPSSQATQVGLDPRPRGSSCLGYLGSIGFPTNAEVQTKQGPVTDPGGPTAQRLRRELQLLMVELKDRDRELNAMAASHHRQLHAWERDRQKTLSLEQRCARLDEELQKRNEVIRVLTKRVWGVETRKEEVQKELGAAQQKLCELERKQQNISQKCQDFEEQNQSLSSTLVALSTTVGSLQVREEELSSMLKLKDKDVTAACGHVDDLTARLQDLETTVTESHSRESDLLRVSEENKRRCRESRHEVTHLKEELQQQVTQSSSQREEIIRLKQELQLLHRDLALSGEGDGWRDELLELARSKQERAASELRCLRQVCENQRSDLQPLQMNLESARGALREKSGRLLPGSQDGRRSVCPDGRSPSALRGENWRRFGDAASPPAANQRGAVDPGVFSPRSIDVRQEHRCVKSTPQRRVSPCRQ
ncbi:coiled-coil domain-containing protein 62 isoform 2-T2 [Spinachia spinachia]